MHRIPFCVIVVLALASSFVFMCMVLLGAGLEVPSSGSVLGSLAQSGPVHSKH